MQFNGTLWKPDLSKLNSRVGNGLTGVPRCLLWDAVCFDSFLVGVKLVEHLLFSYVCNLLTCLWKNCVLQHMNQIEFWRVKYHHPCLGFAGAADKGLLLLFLMHESSEPVNCSPFCIPTLFIVCEERSWFLPLPKRLSVFVEKGPGITVDMSPFVIFQVLSVFKAGHWSAISKGFLSLRKRFCTLYSSYQLYRFWCFALLDIKYDLKCCSLLVHCKQCILELSSPCIYAPIHALLFIFMTNLWSSS